MVPRKVSADVPCAPDSGHSRAVYTLEIYRIYITSITKYVLRIGFVSLFPRRGDYSLTAFIQRFFREVNIFEKTYLQIA